MLALALTFLTAAPALSDDDVTQRREAVGQWLKKVRKPQLALKDALAVTQCVSLAAVDGTGCTESPRLCRLQEGDDGSSGTRVESTSLVLEGSTRPVRIAWTATYEPPVTECEPPEELEGHESEEHHRKEVAAWKSAHAREFAACLVRVKKKADADAEELKCDVVLVNACRKEAWLTCKTRNVRKAMGTLEALHRVEL